MFRSNSGSDQYSVEMPKYDEGTFTALDAGPIVTTAWGSWEGLPAACARLGFVARVDANSVV
jgi:hypothetical protein